MALAILSAAVLCRRVQGDVFEPLPSILCTELYDCINT